MIDNKTTLNSSLFTPVSSGSIDVIMPLYPEDKRDNKQHPFKSRTTDDRWWEYGPSINNKPILTDPDKKANISIGDRYTVFLEQLFANNFFIDLLRLGRHKTVFVNFRTTREFSFSLQRTGNRRFPFNVTFGRGTEKWGRGNVRNLENYFEGYPEDQILEFNVMVHKSNSHRYYVELDVSENSATFHTIKYLPNGGRNTFMNQVLYVTTVDAPKLEETLIRPTGLNKLKGWNINADGSGKMYYPSDLITPVEDMTLYAIWENRTVPSQRLTNWLLSSGYWNMNGIWEDTGIWIN